MRSVFLMPLFIMVICGCSHGTAVMPDTAEQPIPDISIESTPDNGNHYLWGEWTLYINAEHDKVDMVPRRQGRFHLNALKFLEEYCSNCLEIKNIQNNGDGTVNLTVKITHPFSGFPEYTGFDVKGIIMFDGSYEFPNESTKFELPTPFFRISWRETGDPEVLNPDGFTVRWTPDYESGSDLPMFNYWEGKYASGVPDADLNAYLNFYSIEERHIFETNSIVERTYTIWVPPGEPVIAAYAVEASWVPPMVTPVTDPVNDFPISANQPEAYHFRYVVNNEEVITDCDDMPIMGKVCDVLYMEVKKWGGITDIYNAMYRVFLPDGHFTGGGLEECVPPIQDRYASPQLSVCKFGNGLFRGYSVNFRNDAGWTKDISYTLFDYTVNDPDL